METTTATDEAVARWNVVRFEGRKQLAYRTLMSFSEPKRAFFLRDNKLSAPEDVLSLKAGTGARAGRDPRPVLILNAAASAHELSPEPILDMIDEMWQQDQEALAQTPTTAATAHASSETTYSPDQLPSQLPNQLPDQLPAPPQAPRHSVPDVFLNGALVNTHNLPVGWFVYTYITTSGPIYIGKTTQQPHERFRQHLRNADSPWARHPDLIRIDLEEFDTGAEMDQAERDLIASTPNLLNTRMVQ